MSKPTRTLEEIRAAIDGIDSEVLRLVNERARLAQEAAAWPR